MRWTDGPSDRLTLVSVPTETALAFCTYICKLTFLPEQDLDQKAPTSCGLEFIDLNQGCRRWDLSIWDRMWTLGGFPWGSFSVVLREVKTRRHTLGTKPPENLLKSRL